jgi:D-alanine-D-alanine ligase
MTIAVLAGGHSPEREISILSGHQVLNALQGKGYDVAVIDPADTPLLERLTAGDIDAAYIALHGKEGEDGTVQRLLELIGIPYTGTRPFRCQLAFDKALAKEVLADAGIPTPNWAIIEASALRDLSAGHILRHVIDRVGLPAVVKPTRAGSAMGLSFVDTEAELPAAVMGALAFSDSCIVESRVVGTEVTAGFIGSPPEALPLVEIEPRSGTYDYASRYTTGATDYFSPARLGAEAAAAASAEALHAFEALGLRDVGRTDVIVDADGKPWVLEVNVCPGLTEMSLLPMAARAAGLSPADLIDRVLGLALQRS